MAALGQTVAVIDKSGKIVSTSKHLLGVFKEARSAYRDRKAEIKTGRHGGSKKVDKDVIEAQRALEAYSLEEPRSVASTMRNGSVQRSQSAGRHRGHASSRHQSHHHNHHHHSQRRRSYQEHDVQSATGSRRASRRASPPAQSLARRHTSHDVAVMEPRHHPGTRSHSVPHVDMDLAYGEFHPSSIADEDPDREVEGLVGKVKMALEEADCAHKSVTAIVAHLQKHPDAMAAVALTLAEISNLVTKMGPAALATVKSSAPAVFALLSSPQFMIAAGVGIGVTVVMFGGYKIVKQIQNTKKEANGGVAEGSMDEMVELRSRVSKIEHWRRGVADSEAESAGTSVDGEFITPTAANMSGIRLPSRVHEVRRDEVADTDNGSQYSRRSRGTRASRSSRRSKTPSKAPTGKDKSVKDKKEKDKKKKPSPLRMMLFKK